MQIFWKAAALIIIAVAIISFVCEGNAYASGTGTDLPWEKSLETLQKSLTGKVAFALGLFMIVCGFCAVAFTGADMGGWVRWIAVAAILAGMLGMAPTVLSLFGLNSAMTL